MRACVSVMYHILILSVITSDYNSQNMHEHNHRLINCSFWAWDRVNYQISPVFSFQNFTITKYFFPWLVVSLDTNSIVNVIKTKQREDGEAVTERSLITILPQSILRITLNVNLEDRCWSFCTKQTQIITRLSRDSMLFTFVIALDQVTMSLSWWTAAN